MTYFLVDETKTPVGAVGDAARPLVLFMLRDGTQRIVRRYTLVQRSTAQRHLRTLKSAEPVHLRRV